jgi:predicted outer membrane repeat protein
MGTISLVGSSFEHNDASYGGAVYVKACTLKVLDSTFDTNTALVSGSGLQADQSWATLDSNTVFVNNHGRGGGAVYSRGSVISAWRCTFEGNRALERGGAIFVWGTGGRQCVIGENVFSGNVCSGRSGSYIYGGGAIYAESTDSLLIYRNHFENNQVKEGTATYHGGAVLSRWSRVEIFDNEFESNFAKSRGGALASLEGSKSDIRGNQFNNNSSRNAGGAVYLSATDGYLHGNLLSNNETVYGGGAIHLLNVTSAELSNVTLTGNTAVDAIGDGGGILANASSMSIRNSIIWGNECGSNGPQIWLKNGSQADVRYSNVEGSWPGGEGNINADPLFVVGPEGPFYLSQTDAGQAVQSPCVDAGGDLVTDVGMWTLHTRTDGVDDVGTVDMGFHYNWIASPVYLSSFELWPAEFGIDIRWEVSSDSDQADFLLQGSRDAEVWEVGYRSHSPGVFTARDENPQVSAGGLINYRLFLRDNETGWRLLRSESVTSPGVPPSAALLGSYPNPFNPRTRIVFSLPSRQRATLTIHDTKGRLVKRLVDGSHDRGVQSVIWNGEDDSGLQVASGIYIVRLTTSRFAESRKLALVR